MNPPPSDLAAIEQALLARRYGEVDAICRRMLQADPNRAQVHHLLGVAAFEQRRLEDAAVAFRRAAELEPREPRHLARLAATLELGGQSTAARDTALTAAKLSIRDPLTLDTLGVVLTRTSRYKDALRLFERAVALQPGNGHLLHNLGWGRQYLGDMKGAVQAYRQQLRVDPTDAGAWQALVSLEKQRPDRNNAAELEALFQRFRDDQVRTLYLGHALAKTYEDLGDWGGSLTWLQRGKALTLQRTPYSAQTEHAAFAAAAESCEGSAPPSAGPVGPIFVVGLPRTGTTLVERVLSSHPAVASAGELKVFAGLVKRMGGVGGPRLWDAASFRAARRIDPTELGRAYLQELEGRAGRSTLMIDKLPFNFLFAKLILRAMPTARIICVRRDPIDATLSGYRQLFSIGGALHTYALDLARAADYTAKAGALMDLWRDQLSGERYIEVRYETLVGDLEGQSRRLLDFLGLRFDAKVLAFHRNEKGVQTASVAQVRRPIHDESVGRWRLYPPELIAPALHVLGNV